MSNLDLAEVGGRTDWAEALLAAGNDRSSFQRLEAAGTAFWFPVEETLHSAQYIAQNERGNVDYWVDAVRRAKEKSTTGACRVLDVGANGGYYSLLSRALGCAVLSVDAQPRCLQRLASAAAVNGWRDGWETKWTAVSDVANLTVVVGATKCSGLWAVRESDWINRESASETTVSAQPLTALIAAWAPSLLADDLPADDPPVAALKVDVEGSEVAVLASAMPLLRRRRIGAVLAEFVPARIRAISPLETIERTFTDMYAAGYQCGRVGGVLLRLPEMLSYIRDTPSSGGGKMDWRCDLT